MAGSQVTNRLMSAQAAKLYLRCRKGFFKKKLAEMNVCMSPADVHLALASFLEEHPKQARMLKTANWRIEDLAREIKYV